MSDVSETDVRAVFDSFDLDHSGVIDASELGKALTQLYGKEKSADEINVLAGEIFKETDENKDKKITWDEFKKATVG